MINLEGIEYKNWKDYFKNIFEASQKYERIEIGFQGNTFYENYIPKEKKNQTTIQIGYYDETLILWKFKNPKTIGYSKKQDIEYFYRFDYTPGESYGGPGLEFLEINLIEINKQLKNGISGKEVQYFKNKNLVKSKIYINYEGKETKYPDTIYFEKRSFTEKLMQLFRKEKHLEFTTVEINLLEIFSGI